MLNFMQVREVLQFTSFIQMEQDYTRFSAVEAGDSTIQISVLTQKVLSSHQILQANLLIPSQCLTSFSHMVRSSLLE
jgi:hypothetical protein